MFEAVKIKNDKMWSHAEEQKLIELWKAGATGALIAATLGRTRSTILGKVHRMRNYGLLEYRDEPTRRKAEAARKQAIKDAKPKQERGGKRVMRVDNRGFIIKIGSTAPRFKPEPYVAPSKAPEVPFDPNKNYPTITELGRTMCRFIMTDDTSPTALYCGEPVLRLSYCKCHHARLYHRVATNRKLAA